MVAVIERLAIDFGRFAPELDASPKRCIYRMYRDTRFSDDKTPLKTQIAASFRWRGLPRGRSAGLYVEVHPRWVWMGGGFYAPETVDLVRIRGAHLGDASRTAPVDARAPRSSVPFRQLEGERLTRLPRGFLKDDPAAEYLRHRNFLVGREFPPEFATTRDFYPTLLATFKAATPLVRFLNEPLLAGD